MKWCSNNCHDKPMWCGYKTCVNRADYATRMQKKRDDKGITDNRSSSTDKSNISKGFKIALAAITSAKDYVSLEDQFFHLKD